MQLPIYEQHLEGSMTAHLIPEGQCGFSVGLNEFAFAINIKADALDDHGFLYDNKELDALADHYAGGQWQASCEDLAGGLLLQIMKVLGNRALEITITVRPNDFAALSVTWRRGMSKPQWLPRKVDAPTSQAAQQ
jgi:hypothetical protein